MRNAIPFFAQTYGADISYVVKFYPPIAPSGLESTEFSIKSIGDFSSQARLDGASTYSSINVSLIDSTGWLLSAIQDSALEGLRCDIFIVTDLQGTRTLFLKGRTTGAPTFNEEDNTLSFSVESFYLARPVDTSLDNLTPDLPLTALNKPIPIVSGWGYRVPAVKVGGAINFKAKIVARYEDATIVIPGANVLPQQQSIQINVGNYTLKGIFLGDLFTPDHTWTCDLGTIPLDQDMSSIGDEDPTYGTNNYSSFFVSGDTPIHGNVINISYDETVYPPDGSTEYTERVTTQAQVQFVAGKYKLVLPHMWNNYPQNIQLFGYIPGQNEYAFNGEYQVTYIPDNYTGKAEYLIFGDGNDHHTIKKIEAKFEGTEDLAFLDQSLLSLQYMNYQTTDGRIVTALKISVREYCYGTNGMDFSEIYVTSCDTWKGLPVNDVLDSGIAPQTLLTNLVTKWMPGYTTSFPADFTTKTLRMNFEHYEVTDPYELISKVAREALLTTTIDGAIIRFRNMFDTTSVFTFNNENILFKSVQISHRPESELQNDIAITIKQYGTTAQYTYKGPQIDYGKHQGSLNIDYWREINAATAIADFLAKRLSHTYRQVTFHSTIDAACLEPFDVVTFDTELISTTIGVVTSIAIDSNAMCCDVTVLLVDEDYFLITPFTTVETYPDINYVYPSTAPTDKEFTPQPNIYRIHMFLDEATIDLYDTHNTQGQNFEPVIIPLYSPSVISFRLFITQQLTRSAGDWVMTKTVRTKKFGKVQLSLPGLDKYGWTIALNRSDAIATVSDNIVTILSGTSGQYWAFILPGNVPMEPAEGICGSGQIGAKIKAEFVRDDTTSGLSAFYIIGAEDKVIPAEYDITLWANTVGKMRITGVTPSVPSGLDSFKLYPYSTINIWINDYLNYSYPSTTRLSFKCLMAVHNPQNNQWVMKEVAIPGISNLGPFTRSTLPTTLQVQDLPEVTERGPVYICVYEEPSYDGNGHPYTYMLPSMITQNCMYLEPLGVEVVQIGTAVSANNPENNLFNCTIYPKGTVPIVAQTAAQIAAEIAANLSAFNAATTVAYGAVSAEQAYNGWVNQYNLYAYNYTEYEKYKSFYYMPYYDCPTISDIRAARDNVVTTYNNWRTSVAKSQAGGTGKCKILNFAPTATEILNASANGIYSRVYQKYMLARVYRRGDLNEPIFEGNLDIPSANIKAEFIEILTWNSWVSAFEGTAYMYSETGFYGTEPDTATLKHICSLPNLTGPVASYIGKKVRVVLTSTQTNLSVTTKYYMSDFQIPAPIPLPADHTFTTTAFGSGNRLTHALP